MNGFLKSLGRVSELRRKFEALIAAARSRVPGARTGAPEVPSRLREFTAFGSNPGGLRMFAYAPERLASAPPLVVVLHGCGQSADEFDHGTGWSRLADGHGFVVVFPQQQPSNNPKNCFSWFVPGDIERDQGEAHSIHQMVECAAAKYGVDRSRVFVTGLSAGGAMASVMLATYPDVYAGGAIIAGLPYGCASSVQQALEAMFTEQTSTAQDLGNRVRAASGHRGPWPRIAVWHGSADPIVKPSNAEQIIRQWANVHGLDGGPTHSETIGGHTRREWTDADGTTVIEAISIAGMAHGVPIDSPTGAESYGAAGPFFLEAGVCSTRHIARSWGLLEGRTETQGTGAVLAIPPERIRADEGALDVAAKDAGEWRETAEPTRPEATQHARPSLDPNAVIASAFKAAGLPVPELPNGSPGTSPPDLSRNVSPGPIIDAALKAAGIKP